jgi:hypothetical protein
MDLPRPATSFLTWPRNHDQLPLFSSYTNANARGGSWFSAVMLTATMNVHLYFTVKKVASTLIIGLQYAGSTRIRASTPDNIDLFCLASTDHNCRWYIWCLGWSVIWHSTISVLLCTILSNLPIKVSMRALLPFKLCRTGPDMLLGRGWPQ